MADSEHVFPGVKIGVHFGKNRTTMAVFHVQESSRSPYYAWSTETPSCMSADVIIPQEQVNHVMKTLKEHAEKKFHPEKVSIAAIAVPRFFNEYQRSAIQHAAESCFKSHFLYDETMAAALFYMTISTDRGTGVIADMGPGGCSLTIADMRPTGNYLRSFNPFDLTVEGFQCGNEGAIRMFNYLSQAIVPECSLNHESWRKTWETAKAEFCQSGFNSIAKAKFAERCEELIRQINFAEVTVLDKRLLFQLNPEARSHQYPLQLENLLEESWNKNRIIIISEEEMACGSAIFVEQCQKSTSFHVKVTSSNSMRNEMTNIKTKEQLPLTKDIKVPRYCEKIEVEQGCEVDQLTSVFKWEWDELHKTEDPKEIKIEIDSRIKVLDKKGTVIATLFQPSNRWDKLRGRFQQQAGDNGTASETTSQVATSNETQDIPGILQFGVADFGPSVATDRDVAADRTSPLEVFNEQRDSPETPEYRIRQFAHGVAEERDIAADPRSATATALIDRRDSPDVVTSSVPDLGYGVATGEIASDDRSTAPIAFIEQHGAIPDGSPVLNSDSEPEQTYPSSHFEPSNSSSPAVDTLRLQEFHHHTMELRYSGEEALLRGCAEAAAASVLAKAARTESMMIVVEKAVSPGIQVVSMRVRYFADDAVRDDPILMQDSLRATGRQLFKDFTKLWTKAQVSGNWQKVVFGISTDNSLAGLQFHEEMQKHNIRPVWNVANSFEDYLVQECSKHTSERRFFSVLDTVKKLFDKYVVSLLSRNNSSFKILDTYKNIVDLLCDEQLRDYLEYIKSRDWTRSFICDALQSEVFTPMFRSQLNMFREVFRVTDLWSSVLELTGEVPLDEASRKIIDWKNGENCDTAVGDAVMTSFKKTLSLCALPLRNLLVLEENRNQLKEFHRLCQEFLPFELTLQSGDTWKLLEERRRCSTAPSTARRNCNKVSAADIFRNRQASRLLKETMKQQMIMVDLPEEPVARRIKAHLFTASALDMSVSDIESALITSIVPSPEV